MIDPIFKIIRGITRLRGGTDNTIIGNTNDGIKSVIQGNDGNYCADVTLQNGIRRLQTTGLVQIEELFGQDNIADTWFALGTFEDCDGIDSAGDQIRIQIAAGCDAIENPAVDYTYTVTTADMSATFPEISVRDNIISGLNNDTNFKKSWDADSIKDNGIIHISSIFIGEFGERPTSGDFDVTVITGSSVVTIAYDNIIRRGKSTSLSRDPDDKRIGILGISGNVSVSATAVDNIFETDLYNATYGNDMKVNGSVTPIIFRLDALSGFDLFVEEIRFHGTANGIKFSQFLNINTTLTNGIEVKLQSDENLTDFRHIYITDDFKARWASISGFQLDVQAGYDHFDSIRKFNSTALPVIRAAGTFAVDDYIQVTIADNISAIGSLFCTIIGFKKEP